MCIHIYTSICTYTYTCVYVCVWSRQCNRVLYQKPLSLHLLWNDLALSHCEFPIHHPDYKLLLCMTHGSNPVTHSHLLTMNKPVSTVTVMWRDGALTFGHWKGTASSRREQRWKTAVVLHSFICLVQTQDFTPYSYFLNRSPYWAKFFPWIILHFLSFALMTIN